MRNVIQEILWPIELLKNPRDNTMIPGSLQSEKLYFIFVSYQWSAFLGFRYTTHH